MKIRLFICLLLCSIALVSREAPVIIPASDTLIEYSGRIDFSNPDAPKFSYSGVSIRACFKGTAISAILNDERGENYYNIILDRSQITRLQPGSGENTYSLAENLTDTIHEIEIFKLTEEMFGKTSFHGFQLDEQDSLIALTDIREPLIEFIGNSITCGYGNEGSLGGIFGASTENHYMTYAAITSRSFNARHLAVCKSGIGIYRNYDGPAGGNTDCMTNYYSRIYLYDASPLYSFEETPDLVCINLGTNDFSTTGGDSALYVSTYLNFIDSIQNHYSQPDIVCLIGCMMSGATLDKVRRYIQFIVDSANNRGLGNVYFFEMSAQTGDLGTGIDYHPTVAQHMENSRELINFITALKGWSIHPMVLKADVSTTTSIKVKFNTGISDPSENYAGFSVKVNGIAASIDSVFKDPADSFAIYIVLAEEIDFGQQLELGYEQGQIVGTGNIPLESFRTIYIDNNLTHTTLSSGKVNTDGYTISLVFNKKMKMPESLDGLIIENSLSAIEIDSFSVSNTSIRLFALNGIKAGETITASYSGSSLFGEDGVGVTSFTDVELNNQSLLTSSENYQTMEEFFAFYPNPIGNGTMHYIICYHTPENYYSLTFIDLKGDTVCRKELIQHEGELDLSGILAKNNMYIMLLQINNNTYSKLVQY